MYEEEKKNSFIKDMIIKLLYFFLFLFLFMWLYPAPKVDLDEIEAKIDKEALDPLYKQIFNTNINTMKDAGKSYFTIERLPNKVGDKVRLTLKEMLNKKLLIEFTDEEGNTCSSEESYVEVSKTSDSEYNMKVYLSCNNKKDYINEIIGCTDVCTNGICNNSVSTTSNVSATSGGIKNTSPTYIPTYSNPQNINDYVTVVFKSQGGSSVDTQTLKKGNTAYEPITVRDGYTFKCWSTTSNDTNCKYAYNFSSPVYEDKTLYAQWKKNDNIKYEYVKTTWEPNYTWTTSVKSGSDVKRINTRDFEETTYTNKSYTYRTVSWYIGGDNTYRYGLYLNNIPSNASNVRLSSISKFSSSSEFRKYNQNRFTCVIQMVGSGCFSYGDPGIHDTNVPVGSYSYNNSSVYKSNNKWRIDFTINPRNSNDGIEYDAAIKFNVNWNEPKTKYITKYQYSYKTTDTKYSTSSNDINLINQGYVKTGRTITY